MQKKLNIAADSLSRPGPEVATCTDQSVEGCCVINSLLYSFV